MNGAAVQDGRGQTVEAAAPLKTLMSNMDNLRQTYRFIESYHARLNVMPTQREIGVAFGLSPDAANYRLKRMKALGWLNYGGQQSIVLKGMPQRDDG